MTTRWRWLKAILDERSGLSILSVSWKSEGRHIGHRVVTRALRSSACRATARARRGICTLSAPPAQTSTISTQGPLAVNRTPSHITLSRVLHACSTVSHVTLAHGVGARHTIHVSCACVCDPSSTLHFALFTVSPIFYFILRIFHFTFNVGRFGVNPLVRFRE